MGAFGLEGVDVEAEGGEVVRGPEVGFCGLELGVQGSVGGGVAPEMGDGEGEDGAGDELAGGCGGGEADDGEGGLRSVRYVCFC